MKLTKLETKKETKAFFISLHKEYAKALESADLSQLRDITYSISVAYATMRNQALFHKWFDEYVRSLNLIEE